MKPESLPVGQEKHLKRDNRAIAKIVKADKFKTVAAVSREFNAVMKNNLSR